MKKLKLIVSAYGCEPNKGSESGTGWFWIECLSKHFEIWVITRSNNKESIVNSPLYQNWENVHFIYYDLPYKITRLKKGEKGFYWYYFLWQKGIVKIAKQIVKQQEIDYVMHLTFGSIWLPTYIHKINCPFIWGPVGGGEAIPRCYLNQFSLKEQLVQKGRRLLISVSNLNISLRDRCKKAQLIIVRTQDTLMALPEKYREKAVIMLETAVSDDTLKRLQPLRKSSKETEKVQIVYTGRLIPLKAVDIAISAIALMKKRESVKFTIVGKGFLKKELEERVKQFGLEKQIEFLGQIPREQVLELLKRADIFLFPSLKEGGTWALMEAMAAGLPCVCMDTSGMSVIADDNSAIRIEPQKREETAIKMAGALDYLVDNPAKAVELGINARERIKNEFTWEAKERFIVAQLEKLEERKNESVNAKQK